MILGRGPLRNVDPNTVTPEQWRNAKVFQRAAFHRHWAKRGLMYHVCLTCGFPTVYGQGVCVSCRPELEL